MEYQHEKPNSGRHETGDAREARTKAGAGDALRYMASIPLAEIRHSFEGLSDKYPPVLSLEQAAELAKLAPSTLKRKVSEGCFMTSVSPGKPLRFWRDRFVQDIMK